MQHQLIHHGQGSRTWAIALGSNEDLNACLEDFARRELRDATHFTATGSLQAVVLDHVEGDGRPRRRRTLKLPAQVISLAGDIVLQHGKPQIHMRAVLGAQDGSILDGQLLEGHVAHGLEVVMVETPVRLHKDYDADAGLALFKSGASS